MMKSSLHNTQNTSFSSSRALKDQRYLDTALASIESVSEINTEQNVEEGPSLLHVTGRHYGEILDPVWALGH